MKVCILGARGYIKPEAEGYRRHAGVLIDDKILLDIGETDYLKYSPKAVFITHLHADHAAFVGTPFRIDCPVYAPENHSPAQALHETIKIDDYTITPIPTIHSQRVKSQAYLVEKDGKSLLYTGDIIKINPAYEHLLKKCDAVITEGSYIRRGGLVRRNDQTGEVSGHTGIPDLIDKFSQLTNTIILTHFGSWFVRNPEAGKPKILELAKPGLDIQISHDGSCYEI